MARLPPRFGRRVRDSLQDPLRRFQLSLVILFALAVAGTVGYMLLEGMTAVEAVYMTVITLTTVGFGEVRTLDPAGRIFTIGLIVLGVGFGALAVTNAVEVLLGKTLWLSLQRRKMTAALERLDDHYIICGYGRFGVQIARDLRARGEEFVVVEQAEEMEEHFLQEEVPYAIGDATHDEVLLGVGIGRARGLVSALDSDANNLMTVLTARELNPDLLIVARALVEETESKLQRAGADRVVTPDSIGGHRLALALLRPVVHDFLSGIFSFGQKSDVDLGQLTVSEESPFAGQTIAGCDLRRVSNVSILGVRDGEGEFAFNPDSQRRIQSGETLILIGPAEAIYELEALYSGD